MLSALLGKSSSGGTIIPTTSFATPADRVTTPAEVPSKFSSVKILHKTGNAYTSIVLKPTPDAIREARGPEGWGSYRDSNGDADEEHVHAEIDIYDALVIGKLAMQPPGQSTAQGKRQGQAGKGDRGGDSPVAYEESNVRLQSDEEKIQDKSEICNESEVRNGLLRKDGSSKVRDPTHH